MVKAFLRERVEAGPLQGREQAALLVLFVGTVALRLIPTVFFPSLNHQDELFQTLEQAHRLVFGYGEVPWEFHLGARSWLLPGALAGLMWLGDQLRDSPTDYLGAAHLGLAMLAATSILCAFFWGRRWFGFWGGLVAASLPALWPDAVYFGARSLSACAAAPLLVIGLYYLDAPARGFARTRKFVAGLFLGLATAVRLQLAPALALVLLWRGIALARRRTTLRAEAPLLIGIAMALGAAGLLDALTWRYPFQSFWLYFDYNALYGVAADFGTQPWYFYLVGLIDHWGWCFPVILALALLGGRRLTLPLTAALVILATHSLVGHKEYRFIYPAILLLLITGGIGLAQLVAWFGSLSSGSARGAAFAALAGTAVASAVYAASPAMQPMWRGNHDLIEAATLVSRLDHVCGIGAEGTYGGYAYFHHDVPFYWLRHAGDLKRDAPGFDVLLTTKSLPQGFADLRCFGDICVARRAGTCAPIAPRPVFLTSPVAASATPG